MSSSEESDMESTPPDILIKAENGTLPPKSRERYTNVYNNFITWKTRRNFDTLSENVLMTYFNELSVKYKPSTLWCIYSMLKSTLKTNNDIDLKRYIKLHLFLTRQSDGFTRRERSQVFTAANVEKFLNDAPDHKYLVTKAIFIFGISGPCTRQELADLNESDIETHGDLLLVKIPNIGTKIPRTFTIHGEFYAIVKKYQALRIANTKSKRFFQNYQNGKCTRQVIGINKIGSIPKVIAKFLKLENPTSYTSHSFKSTSVKLLGKSRANNIRLNGYKGWHSNNVAEGSIEKSVHNKIEIGEAIAEDNKKYINITLESHHSEDIKTPPSSPSLQDPLSPPSSPRTSFKPDSPIQHNMCEISNFSQTIKLPNKQVSLNFNNCSNFTIIFEK